MLYCFLDTNILLHFQTFDEVDWHQKLGVDGVCLVVTLQVIDDIDKFKNDASNRRRQKRARVIDKKLDRYETETENHIRPRVALRIPKPVPKGWLQANDFDPEDTDSVIIGNAKYFSDSNPGLDVACISDDSGFRRRAKLHGVKCIEPEGKIEHLPPETDHKDAKIKELERVVDELRNTRLEPKLVAGFRSKGQLQKTIRFQVDFDSQFKTSEEIEHAVAAEREKLEYRGHIKIEKPEESDSKEIVRITSFEQLTTLGGLVSGFQYPSAQEVSDYEQAVDKYIVLYREYLLQYATAYSNASKTRPLYLIIENMGTLPAEDVTIKLHFPNELEITEEPPDFPRPPAQPQKPRTKSISESIIGSQLGIFPELYRSFASDPFLISPHFPSAPPSAKGPFIRKTNSYDVRFELANLRHHDLYEWQPFFIRFDKPSKLPTAFEVTCRILAANLPHPAEYKLRVHIDRTRKGA